MSGLNLWALSPGSVAAPVNQKHSPRSPGRPQLVKNAWTEGMHCPSWYSEAASPLSFHSQVGS